MIRLLIEKETKHLIQSPKFIATFMAGTFLILLSVFVGIMDFRAATDQYNAATQLNRQKTDDAISYTSISVNALRKPDPMQIFITGVYNDIGRLATIHRFEPVKLTNSIYSDDPIFAVFRFLDLSFIVQMILALFAILFTYDAVNGERENGTLKLVFSHSVSRVGFLAGKFFGTWIGLLLPLTIPILLAALMTIAFGIPLAGIHWIKLTIFMGLSLVYLTVFVALGIFISSLTRESSSSFLLLLIIWVSTTLIIPRTSLLIADKLIPVPTVAEMEGQMDKYAKDCRTRHEQALSRRWRERSDGMQAMSAEEREAWRDDHLWNWMEEDDKAREETEQEIFQFSRKLQNDLRNKKSRQETYAFNLSRLAPAASFQLAAMKLAGTDIDVKNRYMDAMNSFRDSFTSFLEKKQKESGQHDGLQISISSDGGFNVSTPRNKGKLNIDGIPAFEGAQQNFRDSVYGVTGDLFLLTLAAALCFILAMVGFLRYDVR